MDPRNRTKSGSLGCRPGFGEAADQVKLVRSSMPLPASRRKGRAPRRAAARETGSGGQPNSPLAAAYISQGVAQPRPNRSKPRSRRGAITETASTLQDRGPLPLSGLGRPLRRSGGRYTPNAVAYIVRYEQGPIPVNGDAHRTPERIAIAVQESRQHIN